MIFQPALTGQAVARANLLGPAAADAILHFRRPSMDDAVAYALFPSCAEAPIVYPTLRRLARAIHAARGSAGLQLVDDQLMLQGSDKPRAIVSVYLQDEGGSQAGFIGHAWLNGRSRRELEAALFALSPNRRTHVWSA